MNASVLTWITCAAATVGVIIRPFKWPEAIWAIGGAALLILLQLIPVSDALHAVGKGSDVYLFLIGMMLLSEVARREGLFDWVAVMAVNHARGSPKRLFLLLYAVGTAVTIFLSNDATAVVLTPAVFAAARKAKAQPLPFLFVCAFIANAASFVLPISNPANLVLYGNHMPALGIWLKRFLLPSAVSILVTYLALRWTQRRLLEGSCTTNLAPEPLSTNGRMALTAIGLTALTLLVVSALNEPLGLPTAILGVLAMTILQIRHRSSPWPVLKNVSWSVLPLVAGLFVLVEAVQRTGVLGGLASSMEHGARMAPTSTAAVAGTSVALASNLINNLPAGLIASSLTAMSHPPQRIVDALLIGVDLGPNLSVTGSLATILWLMAIRREGEDVRFIDFLRIGFWVMPVALVVTLGMRMLWA